MIYCPHCKKPSARTSGPCPHCGQELGKAGTPPDAAGRRPVEGAKARAGDDFDMGDASASGIELAGDDYVPPLEAQPGIPTAPAKAREDTSRAGGSGLSLAPVEQPSPKSPPAAAQIQAAGEPTQSEVSDLGGFGKAPAGFLETVKYGLRVRARRKVLTAERLIAAEVKLGDDERLFALRGDLGREVHARGLADPAMEHLISRAIGLEKSLAGALERKEGLDSQHAQSLRRLEVEEREIEALAAPVREREVAASLRVDSLEADRRRMEGRIKRSQIELRNIAEMIEKRQKDFADLARPKEERDRLLAEIADLDRSQPDIHARIRADVDASTALEPPAQEARKVLEKVRAELAELTERMNVLRGERGRLDKVYGQAAGNVEREVEAERREAKGAWAAVGERAVAQGIHRAEAVSGLGEAVVAAARTVETSTRRLSLLERACEAYDHDAYGRAKMIGVGLAVAALIVVSVAIAIALY